MSISVELLTKKGALISDFNVNAQLNCSHNETLSKVGKNERFGVWDKMQSCPRFDCCLFSVIFLVYSSRSFMLIVTSLDFV